MKRTIWGGISATILSFVLSVVPAFAVGTNGSFEIGNDPGTFTTLSAPNTTDITNWSVDSGSVDYIGTLWQAADGGRSVDLNGLEAGSVSQVVPTVIGATYDVSFYMSGNPSNRPAEDPLFSPTLKAMSVSATGAAPQNFTFDTALKGNDFVDMKWEQHTYSFVATSVSTTLTFASQIVGAFGPALDNVTIQETLPPQCDINASHTVVSDTTTQVDSHDAVAVTPHPAWTSIAGATWVYSEALDGNGSSPTGTKTFSKTFTITGTPLDSSLEIAADNMYSVSVNGNVISTGTSGTDLNNFSASDTWVIPAADLVTGVNTLTIVVTNPAVDPDTQVPFGDPNPGGLLYKLTVNHNECPPPAIDSTVHIFKYIDDVQATPVSAENVNFPMFTATYNAPFTLGPAGWTTGDIPYEASTSAMPLGSSYSAEENTTTPLVGTSCDGVHPYALVGYSVGDTLLAAQQAAPSLTIPAFTNLQGDKYIIVHNMRCEVTPPTFLKVHILKYLNGTKADTTSASGYQFPMTATWMTANLNGGVSSSGTYVLGNNHGGAADQYGADTASMQAPADYTTSEITSNTDASSQVLPVGAECIPGKYRLNGYKTSAVSFADAALQSLTPAAPVFTDITADQYVLVVNEKCAYPTRSQGFWQTHTTFTSNIFASSSMQKFVGSGSHRGAITNTQTAGASQLFGAFYSSIPYKSNGTTKRSATDKTRMQLLQQLVAAKLNCAAFTCSPSTLAIITAADAAYVAGSAAMESLATQLDAYNNSGEGAPIPSFLGNGGSATPATSQLWANKTFWDLP